MIDAPVCPDCGCVMVARGPDHNRCSSCLLVQPKEEWQIRLRVPSDDDEAERAWGEIEDAYQARFVEPQIELDALRGAVLLGAIGIAMQFVINAKAVEL